MCIKCIDWRGKTVRNQVLYRLGCGVVGLLLCFTLGCGLYASLSISSHASHTEAAMREQVLSSTASIINRGSARLTLRLQSLIGNVALMSFARQDLTRADYPYEPDMNAVMYMDDPSLLPISQRTYAAKYANFTLPITFARSSYHIPKKTPADIGGFSTATNRSIGLQFSADLIAKRLVEDARGSIASLYTGVVQDFLFIEHPGVGATNVTNYNWSTADPLSQISLNSPGEMVVSEPYIDPYLRQPLLSFYRAYKNLPPGTGVGGIVGADIILTELTQIVSDVQFGNISRTALFDSFTNESVVDSASLRSNLASDLIIQTDSGLWDVLYGGAMAAGVDSSFSIVEPDYFYVMQRQATNDYLLLTRVPTSYIQAIMRQIEELNSNAKRDVALTESFVTLGLTLLAILVVIWQVNIAIFSLPELEQEIASIPEKYVATATKKAAIAEVPVPAPKELSIHEASNLREQLRNVIPVWNRSRAIPGLPPINPHYNPNHLLQISQQPPAMAQPIALRVPQIVTLMSSPPQMVAVHQLPIYMQPPGTTAAIEMTPVVITIPNNAPPPY